MSLTQLGLDPECKWTEAALAQKLGIIQQTINSWISDIRARQRANRNIIIRLSRLACPVSFWRGRTQKQIAEVVRISQGRVPKLLISPKLVFPIISDTRFWLNAIVSEFFSWGHQRRLRQMIMVFLLAFCRARISEIQELIVCCITPNFCARAACVHLHSGSNPNWVKLNWVVISYSLMVIGFQVSMGKVTFHHACPPSLSLRRVSDSPEFRCPHFSESRNPEAGLRKSETGTRKRAGIELSKSRWYLVK